MWRGQEQAVLLQAATPRSSLESATCQVRVPGMDSHFIVSPTRRMHGEEAALHESVP